MNEASIILGGGGANSVFQPYYDMPHPVVIDEWVIVLESLLQDVYSVHGSEQILIEALIYQCLMTIFHEQDIDGAVKIVTKIKTLLHKAQTCSPEIIVMCMTLTGLISEMASDIQLFPIETEKSYIAALILSFQMYGDPRGRGNYTVPYYLFYAWKLSLLALADGKKVVDSELAEELFDCVLHSLFNHKRLYKKHHIEIAAAQEHAHNSTIGS